WRLCGPTRAILAGQGGRGLVPGELVGQKQEERRGVAPALGGKEGGWLADAVNALAVLAACGVYGQPHFLAQRPADEPAYRVGLPAGGFHNLGERRAALALEQAQDLSLLAAVARCGGLAASFAAFPLGSFGRLGLG